MKTKIRSIRAKLMLLTTLSSGVGLLLAGLLIGVSGYRDDYRALQERSATQARITAENSVAAVAFSDPTAAAKTLEALRLDPDISSALIERADGAVLASIDFRRPPGGRPLAVTAPVQLDERIGTVRLQVSSA